MLYYDLLKFIILPALLLPHSVLGQAPVGCGMGTATTRWLVTPVVDMPNASYVYECQTDTVELASANVTIYGFDTDDNIAVVDAFCPNGGCRTALTVTPADAVNWRVTQDTCRTFNGATFTPAYCQFVVEVDTPNNQIDYEVLGGSNFEYSIRVRLRSTRNFCRWEILSNLTVYIKDCNETPFFDAGIPTNFRISEYNEDLTGDFAGTIVNLLVQDPDVFHYTYGNVSLSIISIIRPNKANEPVDATPFYIDGHNFLWTNSNNSALKYNTSRCPVVATCLAIFDSWYDTGSGDSLLEFEILAIDGGGLSTTLTLQLTIAEQARKPAFLNLPGNITFQEDYTVATTEQIYPIQMTVSRLITATDWSIQVVDVNPPINIAGGTYVTNGSGVACVPASVSPIYCAPLTFTSLVDGTAFDYSSVQMYNVTIWGINTGGATALPVTTTSSIIINITPKNVQPTLRPATDALYVTEDVQQQDCIYNMSSLPSDANGDTVFDYTYLGATVNDTTDTSMWYLNGTLLCYNGLYSSVGTCCSRVFKASSQPYILTVQITDTKSTPTPFPTFTLTVSIIKIDDPPVINVPKVVSVPETWTNFTFDINATQDHPSGSTNDLIFNITGYSTMYNNALFYISNRTSDRNLGFARIANIGPGPYYYDYLTYSVIYVNISVSDGIYTTQGTVTVFVEYVNRRPVLVNLPNSTELQETTTGYAAIYTVSATDKESDAITYQLITSSGFSQTDDSTFFSIDYNLGVIYYVNPSFDYYIASMYTLEVLIQDNPSGSSAKNATRTGNYTIVMLLVNQAPSYTYPLAGSNQANSTVNVYENATGALPLFTFEGTDRENNSLLYNITSVLPSVNTAFLVPWGSDVLEYNEAYASSTPMFNSTLISAYLVVVEIKDEFHMTNATSTATITISVIAVPKSAVWTSLPGFVSVREDVIYGPTDIFTVGAADPNNGHSALNSTFLGISPISGNSKFGFNDTSQTLYYVNDPQFVYGIQNAYTALFTTTNNIGAAITSSVVISIIRINTGPYNNESLYNYTVTLREDTTSGRLLWDLRAISNQSLGIEYAVKDVTPSIGAFAVSDIGLVTVVDYPGFDYQVASEHKVLIVATDTGQGGGQQAMMVTFTLTVSLIEIAKEPVITNLPNFVSINEGTPGVTSIYIAECRERGNRPITWSNIVLPLSGSSYFSIASDGTISTTSNATLNYFSQPKYLFVAKCEYGGLTATATLTIALVWTTSTSTTTTTTTTTVTTTTEESSGLSTAEIAAICGSIAGALILAAIAFGIAQFLQRDVKKKGITRNIKNYANIQERQIIIR